MAKQLFRMTWLSLLALVILSIITASSASNSVVKSSLGRVVLAKITPNDLKPPECASINVTTLVVGSGTINYSLGPSALILGSAGNDTISGGGSGDCMLGGAGNDRINGKAGSDILLGGPGSDLLISGQVCYGGPGNQPGDVDTFSKCTTRIP